MRLQKLKQEWQKSPAGTRQTDGKNLVWSGEIERKLAKLSKDYFYLPFFLLIILWVSPSDLILATRVDLPQFESSPLENCYKIQCTSAPRAYLIYIWPVVMPSILFFFLCLYTFRCGQFKMTDELTAHM
jgi:hypothetical protein